MLVATLCFAVANQTYASQQASWLGLDGFTKWKLVNENRYSMSFAMAVLCRGPSPEESRILTESPHAKYSVSVFVSSQGVKPMFSGRPFPVGTKIVKQKFDDPESKSAVMSTFMIKRAKGFNPDCGDWEFGTLDGSGKRITSRGMLKECMPCHVGQKSKDFTFRSYVPPPTSR